MGRRSTGSLVRGVGVGVRLTKENTNDQTHRYALRIPILYYVYRKETLFWRLGVRGGGEDSNCSQLRQSLIVPTQDDQQFDDGTIASLQKVLLENRKITVDFFALELLEKIGEGATAEVYKGKLERRLQNIDVAIKLYVVRERDVRARSARISMHFQLHFVVTSTRKPTHSFNLH